MDSDRTSTTRRRLLGTAAGATGVALASTVWRSNEAAAASIPERGQALGADGRAFATGKYALDIGLAKAGWIQSAEGGHAVSDVVSEKMGADHVVRKHLAGVKYEDIQIQTNVTLAPTLYGWISTMFDKAPQRQNGEIHVCDFDNNIVSSREFFNALITEVGFPACDGASKDPAYLSVKFSPEFTRFKKGSGKVTGIVGPDKQQKQWLPSNFRLEIDGLDCARVAKIEALTVKQKVTESPVGEQRDYQREPASLEIPNLVVTIPEAYAKSFLDWHQDFVINGNNGQDKEKDGSLTLLSPDLKTSLAVLQFRHVGIFAVHDLPPPDADRGLLRWLRIEMYVEDLGFSEPQKPVG